jgi:hypothetical protein
LGDSEVEGVFILTFGLPDDAVDEDDSREVIVDDATIDNPFSKFFNSEIEGDIGEDAVNPGSDGLA